MEYIPHILYINLDKRPDRLVEIQSEFGKMGLSGERYSAIHTPEFGQIGCTMSHINVLKIARERNMENVLIFEDDFKFIVSKDEFLFNIKSFFEKKIEYDVLMLSYYLNHSEPVDDIIGRTKDVQTASGYIVHNRFYTTLINRLEEGLPLLIETRNPSKYINDQYWKALQPNSLWYYFKTRMGIQRPSYSNLVNDYVDYKV
jgi:glycosyl transferase, family 25